MPTFLLLLALFGTLSCGQRSRAKPPAETPVTANSSRLEPWSGRSDSIDARWQVTNRP